MRIHAATLWQYDFVSKRMWTIRGFVDLYFLVYLHLGSRRCWISPCTARPDSAWVSQQARNFLMDHDESDIAPKQLMRDNDTKFTEGFDEVFKGSGITVMRNTPRSPNLRAHVERFIQTLKVECLDKFVIVAERHLNYINREFRSHYCCESYCHTTLFAEKAEGFLSGVWFCGVAASALCACNQTMHCWLVEIFPAEYPRAVGQRMDGRDFAAFDCQAQGCGTCADQFGGFCQRHPAFSSTPVGCVTWNAMMAA